MTKLETSDLSATAKEQMNANKMQKSNEKIMLDRALHLYGICYKEDRPLAVMRNCIRIAMHELGDEFTLEIIRYCNSMDITVSDYVDSLAKHLLESYYDIKC